MATIKMNPKQFAQFQQRVTKDAKASLIKAMRLAALDAIPILQQATVNAPPASPGGNVGAVDTGGYRQAWRTRPIRNGVEITNLRTYADVIEEGRRPGAQMPNVTDIERWARRKLYASLGKGQAGPRMSARARANAAKAAAYPIARAIGARGLRGRHVMGSARPDIIKRMEQTVKDYLDMWYRKL